MFDKTIFAEALAQYKKEFSKRWENENFKWKAVKWFQDNWNVNASNFSEMLDKVLDQSVTASLLTSKNRFPRGMIVYFAQNEPEEVRSMSINLFDESIDLIERIDSFKKKADVLLENSLKKEGRMHYQDENAITTYLWLRYPDKYYIYKYSSIKKVAEVLKADCNISKGAYAENIRSFMICCFDSYRHWCKCLGR